MADKIGYIFEDFGTIFLKSKKDLKTQTDAGIDISTDKGGALMRLMGWKGGGIGMHEDGRTDIVEVRLFILFFAMKNVDLSANRLNTSSFIINYLA